MRRLLAFMLPLLLLAASTQLARAEITGSAHDFSTNSWATDRICAVCHTPHNAMLNASPLWNHDLTAASFTLYDSASLVETPEQPRGVSKLCLSCHDGTVALDSFGGNTGSHFVSGVADLGTDLADDHPVSILWKHQTGAANCTDCHSMHPSAFISPTPFFGGYVECASCHDVHAGTAEDNLLRMSMLNSELCQHCHDK